MACELPHRIRKNKGFTLIELLAAMSILAVIVLLLTRVYTDGANALQFGKRSVDRNTHSRAVMDFIARELSMMTYDYGSNPTNNFLGAAYFSDMDTIFGVGPDDIAFNTLVKSMDDTSTDGRKRSVKHIRYFVDNFIGANGQPLNNAPLYAKYRYALWRDDMHPQVNNSAYFNLTPGSLQWMGDRNNPEVRGKFGMLIDNVRTFDVFVYTDASGASVADWKSFETNQAPIAFLDIYLETMDEKDAERLALLANAVESRGDNPHTDPDLQDYADRVVKRNYRRIHLHNKMGWQDVPR